MNRQYVVQKPGDPNIYLFAAGEWYSYNPQSEPLGSGAMGTVYLGRRVRDNEKIAVKRVKDSFSNVYSIRERAKQEAALAFRHPNLVEMIGYCEYAPNTGPIFILSRFISGITLDNHVKMNLDQREDRLLKITNCILSVLEALDYIHSRGVVHRDIKPSNIMIENGMNVRLMDLGIARMNQGNQYSAYGFIGTPQYAAPEQINRDKNSTVQINASTDLYCLGITFYEAITGVNPFDCDSEAETLAKQMTEKLPSNPLVSKALMQVIWKATEKEQNKRYQSAAAFKSAIQDALIKKNSVFQKIMEALGKNPVLTGACIGIVIAIILLLIL